MDELMKLAFLEVTQHEGWDTAWWAEWAEQVEVYFNLPTCTHCDHRIDFSNTGSHGRCGLCWM